MLNTTLSALTQAQGAQYSTYSGWEMPSHYGDPEAEYRTAHSAAVLRDASHLSRILISGKDHLDFLQRMTTNDFHNLHPDTGLEAVFPDNRGRIVELGTFYRSGTATLAVLGKDENVVATEEESDNVPHEEGDESGESPEDLAPEGEGTGEGGGVQPVATFSKP